MNISLFTKIIVIFAFSITYLTTAQNVAFVSQDSILSAIPEYKINLSKLDSLRSFYVEEINTAKEKLNSNLQILLSTYNIQNNEDIESIKKRINISDLAKLELLLEENKFIEKKVVNYDLLLNAEFTTNLQPILSKVNKLIENYAFKNKIDVVYILEQVRPSILYFDIKKDITKIIIKDLQSKM